MPPRKSLVAVTEGQSTLISLAHEAMALAQMIAESGGELTPEIEAMLEVNSRSLADKLDGYVSVDERFQSEQDHWKRKADACRAISKRFEDARERLRARIKFTMEEMGVGELKGIDHRYKLSPLKPKLVIDSEESLPIDFKMIVQTSVPDKDKIQAALMVGAQVMGARLEPVSRLQAYANAGNK